eukprot:m.87788 g.87788  ORF g.87788 m.87788 type:complete len:1026 (-) comp13129_c2_seq6:2002-5079(-)
MAHDQRHSQHRGRGRHHGHKRNNHRHHGPKRNHHQPPPNPDIYIGLPELFEKDFSIPTSGLTLPSADVLFPEHKAPADCEMMKLKQELNDIKGKLDDKDIVLWKKHTNMMLQTGSVTYEVRRRIECEMCTKAFCKMFEILVAYALAPTSNNVRTVHLCEAPGAFIAATNHYLRQIFRDDLRLEWTGLSLNPFYEDNDPEAMIDFDSFIMNTLPNWYFGSDDKGDIRSSVNIRGLKQDIRNADIVTADGSIDCSVDPNEQENIVAHLHYCEMVAAIQVLKPGGHFVLKMFTLFEKSSIDLLYFLGCCFEKVNVCKPATSTQGNSETYIIARNFKNNLSEAIMEKLLSIVDLRVHYSEVPDLFPADTISEEFLSIVRTCAAKFSRYASDVISRNLRTENKLSYADKSGLSNLKRNVVETFLNRTGIFHIPDRARLVPTVHINGGMQSLNSAAQVSDQHMQALRKVGGALSERREKKGERVESISANRQFPKRKVDSMLQEAMCDTSLDASNDNGPSKRRKIDNDKDKDKVENSNMDTSQPAGKSEEAEPKAEETKDKMYGSFAKRMMDKMGYKEGQGLGKEGSGIIDPVEAEKKNSKSGLGFRELNLDMPLSEIPDSPFFESYDNPKSLPAQTPLYGKTIAFKVTTGAPLLAVTMSKFTMASALRSLTNARRKMFESEAFKAKACSQNLFVASCAAIQHHAKNPVFLDTSGSSLKLAQLDRFFDVCGAASDHTYFAVFGDSPVGFAEYVSWKHGENSTGLCFINNRESCPSGLPCWTGCASKADTKFVFGGEASACVSKLEQLIQNIQEKAEPKWNFAFCDISSWGISQLIEGSALSSEIVGDVAKERHFALLYIKACLLGLCSRDKSLSDKGQPTIAGDLVVRIGDCFTRWSVGILYILYRNFHEVRIIKPHMSSPMDPERFVVCMGYKGVDTATIESINTAVASCERGDYVLGIVSMTNLLESEFLRFVTHSNDRLAERQIATLRFLETDEALGTGEAFEDLGVQAISRLELDSLQNKMSTESVD